MGEVKLGKSLRPDILDFHDYREFLRRHFEYLEISAAAGFSLRSLARESDISASAISMFLNGHRGLSEATLERIGPFLHLSPTDLQYLHLLRGMAEAETLEQRSRYYHKIQNRRTYRGRHPKEFEAFRYLSTWYFVAIREMAALPDFKFDAIWIQARLRTKVALEDISAALKFLEEYGFITRDNTGSPQKNLDCQAGVFKLALGNFHQEMIKQVSSSIDTVKSADRQILGSTLALAEEDMAEAKSIMAEALKKIEDLSHKTLKADTVYHVTLGIAPLTKKRDDGE